MNLDRLRKFLSTDITPSELSKDLDDLIFDFTMVYGQSEDALSPSTFAGYIYTIKELRNIFADMR